MNAIDQIDQVLRRLVRRGACSAFGRGSQRWADLVEFIP